MDINENEDPQQLADELDRIDREVGRLLTPQELEIRRAYIELLIEAENILRDAAG